MRRYALVMAVLGGLVVAGCGGGGSGGGTTSTSASAPTKQNPNEKATITFWHGFSAPRELKTMNAAIAGFEATHPNIKVKPVGNISDDKITAAVRSGNPPDVALSFSTDNTGAFCRSGGFQNLGPYIARDHVDVSRFPAAARAYTQYKGNRCVLPVLADIYGLYYNVGMLKKAGISPPKTISELTAAAKKLTVRNPDGSLKVVGFDPYLGFYENAAAHYAPNFGAQWQDGSGKSTIATSPGWTKMAQWVKGLVDFYGNDNLVRFNSGAGDEFSASNAFETGKLAMAMDGEYRTAFLAAEHPELKYGTAPFPVDDSQSGLYGGGYTTGNIIGIPRGAKHPAAAWELIKYLATNVDAEVTLANGLKNVPTWLPALNSPKLQKTPQFDTFLKALASPYTQTSPITAEGSTNQNLFQNYLAKYQAGTGGDLQAGLQNVDKQIDAAAAQANAGSNVP